MGSNRFTAEEVAEALARAGVAPADHATFVDFQLRFGGRRETWGLNQLVWGILHATSDEWPAGTVEADFDADKGLWDVRCANSHPSDWMSLDQSGRLYWSGILRFEHFDDYFSGRNPLPGSVP